MKAAYQDNFITAYQGDALKVLRKLPAESVHCCVTSPPYWALRSYLPDDHPNKKSELGLERTPEEYVGRMVEYFRAVKRLLREDGTLWLNLGDSYSHGGCGGRDPKKWPKQSRNDHLAVHAKAQTGLKAKDMVGIPWRVAFALQADGWYLRSEIIWCKPNPMPESVTDRPTKSHETIFLLSRSPRYYYDAEAIKEEGEGYGRGTKFRSKKYTNQHSFDNAKPAAQSGTNQPSFAGGRNKRSVWTVATQPYPGAHYATFPPKLIQPCILAGCPEGGTVLDPFAGSGTTGQVARETGRKAILIELNPEDIELRMKERFKQELLPL